MARGKFTIRGLGKYDRGNQIHKEDVDSDEEKPVRKSMVKASKREEDDNQYQSEHLSGETLGANMTEEQMCLIEQEDDWRRKFCEEPNAPELQDLHLGLTNVYENRDRFKYEPETTEEKAVPKLLTKKRRQNLDQLSQKREYSIVKHEEFLKGWKEFTQEVFNGMNWNNVFVAGGAVLANVISDDGVRDSFKGSDIDIFIYGITSDEEANKKLRQIYEVVTKNSKGGEVIKSNRAITILGRHPFRHVQIITRLYRSPAEVLLGFDIDCCTIGFDGKNLWAMDRFIRSLNKCYNLVNTTRRSVTYESRLYKYSKRGFAVAVPLLDKSRVDPSLFKNQFERREGLSKLLMYDHYTRTSGVPNRFASLASNIRRRIGTGRISNIVEEFNQDKLEDFSILTQMNPSDYSEIYLPWGPDPQVLIHIVELTDKANMYGAQQRTGKTPPHKHLFVTGLEAIITGNVQARWCQYCHDEKPLEGDDRYVKGPLVWIKDTPAYQDVDKGFKRTLMTGSFNPLPDDDWEKNVYAETSSKNEREEESHRCSVCNESFISSNQLLRHQRNEGHTKSVSSFSQGESRFKPAEKATPSYSFNEPIKEKKEPMTPTKSSYSFNVEPGYVPSSPSSSSSSSATTSTYVPTTVSSYMSSPQPFNFGVQPGFSAALLQQPVSYSTTIDINPKPFSFSGSAAQVSVPVSVRAYSPYDSSGSLPWEGKTVNTMTKGLLLISQLTRENRITAPQKGKLKDLVIAGNAAFASAIEAYEISRDYEDLIDTMQRLSTK